MTKHIGILTAGGDSPGLNAAIRGVGKAAQNFYGMHIIGFRDGFRGLVENRVIRLEGEFLSGHPRDGPDYDPVPDVPVIEIQGEVISRAVGGDEPVRIINPPRQLGVRRRDALASSTR